MSSNFMQQVRVLLTLSAILAAQALAQGEPSGGPKIAVETVRATTTTLRSTLSAVGTLLADASADLRTEVPGQILSIHFDEGQHVEKGAELFTIEAAVLEAEVNEARANAERSRSAFERARQLHAKQLISSADYDAARANYDVDAARLRSSQARLVKTVIRAPFAGVTGLRRINVGDYATVGQSVVSLVRLDPLRVDFSVPETLLAMLEVGQPIEVSVAAYPDRAFGGHVIAIAPQADVAGHSIQVRASLPNPELLLRPGLVEVISGIAAGDEVVTAGQMKLRDGIAVEPVNEGSTAGI
jgi:membrane fusion protein (multidrug efflux system)